MALSSSLLVCCVTTVSKESFCSWSYLIFPGILLAIKSFATLIGIVRSAYIYCKCKTPNMFYFMLNVLAFLLLLTFAPFITIMVDETPPLLLACRADPKDYMEKVFGGEDVHSYAFLYTYLTISANTVFIDIVVYTQIFNYMRKNAVQVTVLPVTENERRKVKNIITAPSSLLLLLVSIVAMLPPTILLIRSPSSHGGTNATKAITLFKYQLVSTFCLTVVLPVMTIGSSSALRKDIIDIKKSFPCCKEIDESSLTLEEVQRRGVIYTLTNGSANRPPDPGS